MLYLDRGEGALKNVEIAMAAAELLRGAGILITPEEHWHPTIDGVAGKEETFRCRWGSVSLYVPGERTAAPRCSPPAGSEDFYTVGHEVHLEPREQYTI